MPADTKPTSWNPTAVQVTLSLVRQHWPYWNESNGRDHIWIFTHDHGCFTFQHFRYQEVYAKIAPRLKSVHACRYCGFTGAETMSASIRNSVILTHWGLTDNEVRCDLSTDIRMYGCWGRNARLVSHTFSTNAHSVWHVMTHLESCFRQKLLLRAQPWIAVEGQPPALLCAGQRYSGG